MVKFTVIVSLPKPNYTVNQSWHLTQTVPNTFYRDISKECEIMKIVILGNDILSSVRCIHVTVSIGLKNT